MCVDTLLVALRSRVQGALLAVGAPSIGFRVGLVAFESLASEGLPTFALRFVRTRCFDAGTRRRTGRPFHVKLLRASTVDTRPKQT